MALPSIGGATCSTLTGLAAVAMLSLQLAYAHGPAAWIQRGGYQNAAGELCCGERDCGELVAGTIVPTPQGYKVDAFFTGATDAGEAFTQEVHEIVPYSEAQPSPDGTYWRCQWGGARKCFFAPPQST